ncbi:MAG: FAD-binding oxidoreductase [Microcoleaceae cyanobacterium]
MTTYDWIVVGAGITGAAVSYELVKQGFKVLLVEKDHHLCGATRYSYGGLAYWAGTTELTRQLCQEGRDRHQILSEELGAETQFREVDLLLTISADEDPQSLAASYPPFATPPQLLTVAEACKLEPLLNPDAISGALTVRHGHVSPDQTNAAYLQAFKRLGGEIKIAEVTGLTQVKNKITAIQTTEGNYQSNNVLVCAGGLSRQLLKSAGIDVRVHFTHTEVLETPPVDVKLNTIIMSAGMERFKLEADATKPELEYLWDELGNEIVPLIIDRSAVQLLDGRIRMGQPSRILTNPYAKINQVESELMIRQGMGEILPDLKNLPATWSHCLVAFTYDGLPLIGEIPNHEGIYIFSGFSNPLVFVPPLAQRFAQFVKGRPDNIIKQCLPSRL